VVARLYRGVEESHLPTRGLRANRSGWLPSSERRGALRAHRRSGGACFRVWAGRSDLARSGRRRTQRGRNNCPPPPTANRSDHFEQPVELREVHQIADAGLLPIAQPPPARHPRSAPEFLRQHLPRNATTKDEDNAGKTRHGPTRVAVHLSVVVVNLAGAVRRDPTTHLEAARRPYPPTLPPIGKLMR